MITGRKIANGNIGKGVVFGWKTPLIAALHATVSQSVYGIMAANQVARR